MLQVHLTDRMHTQWENILTCLTRAFRVVPDDLPVHILDVDLSLGPHDLCLSGQVTGAAEIQLLPRKRKARQATDSQSDEEDESNFLQHEHAGSDAESLDSNAESGAELECEEPVAADMEAPAELPDDDDEEHNEEQPAGTNVVSQYSNGYFTLENYALRGKGRDVKMRVRPKWADELPEGMGRDYERSKTLRIDQLDTDETNPRYSYFGFKMLGLVASASRNVACVQGISAALV